MRWLLLIGMVSACKGDTPKGGVDDSDIAAAIEACTSFQSTSDRLCDDETDPESDRSFCEERAGFAAARGCTDAYTSFFTCLEAEAPNVSDLDRACLISFSRVSCEFEVGFYDGCLQ